MRSVLGTRLYFFEVFAIANFFLLLFALRNVPLTPFWTLGAVASSIAGGFLLQALIGMAIRLAFAARRGGARELLATYRSKDWIADTIRLAIFSGLWIHTYCWIKLMIPVLHPRLFDQELWNFGRVLFFGHSPTMFMEAVFAGPRVLRVIDWTYANVFFASLNIAGIFMASAPERRLRVAFMNSNALLWLTGAWLYVAVPSLGPAYRFPEV
jgi:hypothetical protein